MSWDLSQVRAAVRQLYDAAGLAYHNWNHIEACLREFESARHLCHDPATVEWAIWFHDCVYNPKRNDNEERSAEVARRMLSDADIPPAHIDIVHGLILDTKHVGEPASMDGPVLVDIDLSILGQHPDVYDAYERAIRLEYSFVDDESFVRGRTAVLWGFLDRASIYRTAHFQKKYERAARGNLSRALRALS